jgi:methionyl-tRNA synthetase
VLSAVKVLTVYLKPVIPVIAERIEKFLNVGSLSYDDLSPLAENHEINKFEHLVQRVEKEKVDTMVEESKEQAAAAEQQEATQLDEPLAEECSFDDFMKVDLRVARVVEAGAVEGADKLLALKLDIGGITKNVFAGIAKAYKPEELEGRLVVCCANLAPRKMRFGVSEGMVLASGPGGSDIFLLGLDEGATPGQRIH